GRLSQFGSGSSCTRCRTPTSRSPPGWARSRSSSPPTSAPGRSTQPTTSAPAQAPPPPPPAPLGPLPRGGGRRGQELFRFRRAGQHLDEHAGRHPGGRALPGVVGQPARPAEPGEPAQPVVAPRPRIPQVVVGVDDHLVLLAELHGAARAVQRPLLRICYHKTA